MRGESGIESDDGFEILGLRPSAPAQPPAAQGSTQGQPLTRRQLREAEAQRRAQHPVPVPSFERETQAVPGLDLSLFAAPTSTSAIPQPAPPLFPAEYTAVPMQSTHARADFPTRSDAARRAARKRGVARRDRVAASVRPSVRPSSQQQSRGAQLSSKLFSMGAMLFAAALLVGMSVPANAFIAVDESQADVQTAVVTMAKQSIEVPADVAEVTIARDAFSVTSYAEMLRAKYGSRSYDYTVTTGAVRWPFPYPVPISSGFGDRVAPCRGCSSSHAGLDFNPGEGAPIYAIADGVVSFSEVSNYGFGNHVILSHVIGGQRVDTVYAHMLMNSIVVATGQEVRAGDLIGLVGSTGQSTGAHLHFEVRLSGVPVDPFAWLKTNAVN